MWTDWCGQRCHAGDVLCLPPRRGEVTLSLKSFLILKTFLLRTVNIQADHLAPVVPSRGDKVKVILGDEDKDMTGQLLSIDSQEGVVKLDHSGDVKMLQLKYLCKMKSDD